MIWVLYSTMSQVPGMEGNACAVAEDLERIGEMRIISGCSCYSPCQCPEGFLHIKEREELKWFSAWSGLMLWMDWIAGAEVPWTDVSIIISGVRCTTMACITATEIIVLC